MIEFIAFLITLTIPGYLVVNRHFQGLEKVVLSVFLSLSITSFLFYVVVSFFGISKEFIYLYALLLLILFLIKAPLLRIIKWMTSIKRIKLNLSKLQRKILPELLGIFLVVFALILSFFFMYANPSILGYDDSSYHLPIIYDIADDGKKTFFSGPHNIYQVRSNQFPLLFESFVGAVKFFLDDSLFRFVSFFSLVFSLFLIFFISKEIGYNEFFSPILYGLSPIILINVRYFYVETFLTMFFLGSVFFVLKYIKTENLFFLSIVGFLSGLMFLTKFTGVIFFVGLFLFLLYKRKFRGAFLFAFIFVLVSLIFVLSHLGIPFGSISVGEYGEVSSEPLTQITLSAFEVKKILLRYFSRNFYIFFIPVLFLVGLIWMNKKEKDFSLLFFVSLLSFLFVTFVVRAYPTATGFTRYFIPIYSLLCIFSGIQLKKIIFLKYKKISLLLFFIFILYILFTSISLLQYFNAESSLRIIQQHHNYLGEGIENDSNVTAWFLNAGALILNFDKATLYDYVWKPSFEGEPCGFLKKNEIDYIMYLHIEKDPIELGDFGVKLRKSLIEQECVELISEGPHNSRTFKVTN